ncbi:hypothetical protein UMM65_03760 [Aureibaculum sp. 2210JD6-5]|uniref:hypothetical protein n=1 Tax=Aureibaculum sp. 2210JD6-5 TaxID=3103957 RepID=UPI002AAE2206|nr:hypothetical protein [Aureibaculum sp. 2210JD6-5]MDY7394343.1 hypothetical protein [Aureibaculum sp. 2210JD6-5]
MITELEKKVGENTSLIDELITKYLLQHLGTNDKKTISDLNAKNKFSFGQKIKLFCDLVTMSKMDKAKFKVYAKINNDLNDNDILNPAYFQNIRNYHTFLINTYSTPSDTNSLQEKLFSATNRLSNNIVRLTQIYTEKPQIYYQKKLKNIFSR